ncbi:hypothetical protein Ciccas_003243 [Cichlidogyrus casuarinus]|uniref:Uncharacterized protein n=1 Tax=Cichlidogyrus casuarinus TaxID=1844966 RepID=A0ABD2QFA8_9PLAT
MVFDEMDKAENSVLLFTPIFKKMHEEMCSHIKTFSMFLNEVNVEDRLLFNQRSDVYLGLLQQASVYPSCVQVFVNLSTPSLDRLLGAHYERGLLGRFLVRSHLYKTTINPMADLFNMGTQRGEFFTEEELYKPIIESTQKNIWQVSSDCPSNTDSYS